MTTAHFVTPLKYVALAFLICFASAVLLIHPVLALDSTSSAVKQKNRLEKIERKMDKIETKIASKEAKLMDKMEDRAAKLASKEAALKLRLEKFKDKKKAEITQRLNINLNRINQNYTQVMKKHLDQMSNLLTKFERLNNKNPAALSSARTAIASASAAVRDQAAKDYTLQVSAESKVRTEVKSARDQLFQDLRAVRGQVLTAKQKVAEALGTKLKPKEATNSGQ